MKYALIASAALAATAARGESKPAAPNPDAPHPAPESCFLDGSQAVAKARMREYRFMAIGADGKPNSHCEVEGNNLIVSATATQDVTCRFELFVPPAPQDPGKGKPPPPKPRVLRRVAVKRSGDEETWAQRPDAKTAGFTVNVTAEKGTSTQRRITRVELAPVDGGCDPAKLEAKL